MTSSGATENFFALGRTVRGTSGLAVNADCRHCGEIVTWSENRLQWMLTDSSSKYWTICQARYDRDKTWAVIPDLVHEPNTDLPPADGDIERWLDA